MKQDKINNWEILQCTQFVSLQ